MNKRDVTPPAGQAWRDRLNKDKIASHSSGPKGAPGNRPNANMRDRFQNTASGVSAQKTRKGSRPG